MCTSSTDWRRKDDVCILDCVSFDHICYILEFFSSASVSFSFLVLTRYHSYIRREGQHSRCILRPFSFRVFCRTGSLGINNMRCTWSQATNPPRPDNTPKKLEARWSKRNLPPICLKIVRPISSTNQLERQQLNLVWIRMDGMWKLHIATASPPASHIKRLFVLKMNTHYLVRVKDYSMNWLIALMTWRLLGVNPQVISQES